ARSDQLRDVRQRALRVVGQHHDVGIVEGLTKERQQPVRGVCERQLRIETDELLVAREHAQLVHRRHALRADETAAYAARLERGLKDAPALVGADDARERRGRIERGQIQRDVCRTAGTLLGRDGSDDRHRRLGRDTPGIAEPILVEHRVPRDEDAHLREIGNLYRHSVRRAESRAVILSAFGAGTLSPTNDAGASGRGRAAEPAEATTARYSAGNNDSKSNSRSSSVTVGGEYVRMNLVWHASQASRRRAAACGSSAALAVSVSAAAAAAASARLWNDEKSSQISGRASVAGVSAFGS